ncbi:hypothetical protein ACOSP7_008419 [Xanthoceras sorbifolium]
MAKLKIAGIWKGDLEVELEQWTIPMLREEVAKQSSLSPETINLICAGKVLKDGDGSEKLSQLGVKNNAKILATRVSIDEGKSLVAEEERSRRLTRVKAAAAALVERHADGSVPLEDFDIELEDQNGEKIRFGSETDRRAMMMGLMLHANAKKLIRRQLYKDALEVLTMGEDAFSLCNPKVIELVDNVPLLQIDMVWCYFMLRDIGWLSVAGIRLQKAREGIERAQGKDSFHMRLLQAGRHPELALHLRMELLEGLQVSDEALSLVMSMGFKEHDAKRALRISNQDVGSAIDFLVEEKAKRVQQREDNNRQIREIMEQKQYGMTPLKKAVDLQRLKALVSIGSSISTPNNDGPSSSGDDENVKGASTTSEIEERDLEMEDALANELTGDVFSDYDIEVTKEGEAINEYLAMIDSAVNA